MTAANMIGKQIRKSLETLVFDHLTFVEAQEQVRLRVQDTMDGFLPCFEMLMAPSRCGKTEVLEAIARDYPSTMVNGVRHIPVLLVYVPSGGGTRALDEAVLNALGVPIPPNVRGENGLKEFMLVQLRNAKVRVILFDEASHLVERGSRIVSEAAADWFKALHTKAVNIGVVMSGIPRLKRLIDENVQLRNRVSKPIFLPPYRYDDRKQRKAFASCVAAFLSEFEEQGCALKMPKDDFVRNCYIASAGHVGLLADFFVALAKSITTPCDITFELCAKASLTRNLPGNGLVKPFHNDRVDDHELMAVLSSELAKYNLSLEPLKHSHAHGSKTSATHSGEFQ